MDNILIIIVEIGMVSNGKYMVQLKEIKYGIVCKYGIIIVELEVFNLLVGENLLIGIVFNVLVDLFVELVMIEEEDFEFYEVLLKEGFFRLKVKLGFSQEEIIVFNFYVKDGFKEGMILKILKEKNSDIRGIYVIVNLEDGIKNYCKKKIVVMLFF